MGAELEKETDVSCLLLPTDSAAERGGFLDMKRPDAEELERMGLLAAKYLDKPEKPDPELR